MRIAIHGARGSRPVSRPDSVRYGGHTTCFSLETPEGVLIIDAGSGLPTLGHELARRAEGKPVTVLFTHFHMDHVMGLPFFEPLYVSGAEISLVCDAGLFPDWTEHLRRYVAPPYWPVDLRAMPGALRLENLPSSGMTRYGVEVTACPLRHPQGSLAYRLDTATGSAVVATDHEPGDPQVDGRLVSFARGADLLLSDAQYTPEELPSFEGWGHGTWRHAVQFAAQAEVDHLVLTHHDPRRTDVELDALLVEARKHFPQTSAAGERAEVPLPAPA